MWEIESSSKANDGLLRKPEPNVYSVRGESEGERGATMKDRGGGGDNT